MEIDQDSVPSTVEAAAKALAAALSQTERGGVISGDTDAVQFTHHETGMDLRNSWSMWEQDTPLWRDAVKQYRIAHADDISGLVMAWATALVREEPFDPQAHCEIYHRHWKRQGMTSLRAGGVFCDPTEI